VIHAGRCLADAELPHGPIVEVSPLPSAGDGAPGTCPSGGCRSYARSYGAPGSQRGYSYTTSSGFTYIPPSGGFVGGQLVRPGPGPMERTVIQLPWPR
jgi:hypothetical protein